MKKTALRIAAITITGITLAFAGMPSHAQGAVMYKAGYMDCNAVGAQGRQAISYVQGVTWAEAHAGNGVGYRSGTQANPAYARAASGQYAAYWNIYALPYIRSGGEDCSLR